MLLTCHGPLAVVAVITTLETLEVFTARWMAFPWFYYSLLPYLGD